jgi:hypothetical protein
MTATMRRRAPAKMIRYATWWTRERGGSPAACLLCNTLPGSVSMWAPIDMQKQKFMYVPENKIHTWVGRMRTNDVQNAQHVCTRKKFNDVILLDAFCKKEYIE